MKKYGVEDLSVEVKALLPNQSPYHDGWIGNVGADPYDTGQPIVSHGQIILIKFYSFLFLTFSC